MIARGLLVVVGGFVGLASTVRAADEFPVGRYVSDLGGGENKWEINFDKDGKYTITANGNKIEAGAYAAGDKTIEFAAESDKDRKAKYSWSVDKGRLSFVKVQEHKVGRAAALTAAPWEKKK